MLYGLISVTEYLRNELYKGKVLLIATALLFVKAENIHWDPAKMYK